LLEFYFLFTLIKVQTKIGPLFIIRAEAQIDFFGDARALCCDCHYHKSVWQKKSPGALREQWRGKDVLVTRP
jgi:hypothetical protein